MIEAARAGLGIVFVLSYQVQAAGGEGRVARGAAALRGAPIPVNAVLPTGRLQPARVKALADLLQERMKGKDLKKLAAGR